MSRPENPKEGLSELTTGRLQWPKNAKNTYSKITFKSEEFTAVCPTTGQPDFYRATVIYQPKDFYLESKTIKFYLWSFRDAGFHCEKLAIKMAEDINEAITPKSVSVILEQLPRGGIGITTEYNLINY
jgi:7-cyano-7-deazaguanine reductase